MNKKDKAVIAKILSLFGEVDKKAALFAKKTGIHCPANCGVCCAKAYVETTAIEMLPLAAHIWSINKADSWLEKVNQAESEGLCVFFEGDKIIPENGRCIFYNLRPIICRLFGFFTVKDKYGKYVYGSCKVIKESCPDAYQSANELISKGFHPSTMTDMSIRVIGMGSDLGRRMLPINRAAKIALEKVGFELMKKQYSYLTPRGVSRIFDPSVTYKNL